LRKTTIFLLFFLFSFNLLNAAEHISETALKSMNKNFIKKIINENSRYRNDIFKLFNSIAGNSNKGVLLLDKFGIFLLSSKRKGLTLIDSKFFRNKNLYTLILIFKDKENSNFLFLSNFLLENNGKKSSLNNLYFSILLNKENKNLKEFFKN